MALINLEGSRNFRSVDPVLTAHGRLRPDTLFRSGAFHGITPSGIDHMRRLGTTRVFDLRNRKEIGGRLSPLSAYPDFKVFSVGHDLLTGDLKAILERPGMDSANLSGEMRRIYRSMPETFAQIYRGWLKTGIDHGFPLVLHCAAGKDRTGVGIALLLEWLGASRDDIFADYLETNLSRDKLKARMMAADPAGARPRVADHLIEPLITADPTYLASAFDGLEDTYGSIGAYVSDGLGLSRADQEAVAASLVA